MTKLMTVQELQRACREGWRPQVVDVRSASEFSAGHIPCAINIPLTEMDTRGRDLNRLLPLVLVSQNGRRAELAARMLAGGPGTITVIMGGTGAWASAGLPMVASQPTRWSMERQARLGAGLLLLAAVVLSAFVHPAWVYLAAFVGCGMTFAGITDSCLMAIVLGRMPWNRSPCPQPSGADVEGEATEAPAA